MLRKLLFLLFFSSRLFASNNFLNEDSRQGPKRQLETYKQEQAKKLGITSMHNPTAPTATAQLLSLKLKSDLRKRTHTTAFPNDGYYSPSDSSESDTSE